MDDDLRQKFQSLPFFLAGQSIGGPLSLLIGIEIKHHDGTWATIADRFKGVMTTSPAIMGEVILTRPVIVSRKIHMGYLQSLQHTRCIQSIRALRQYVGTRLRAA